MYTTMTFAARPNPSLEPIRVGKPPLSAASKLKGEIVVFE
jgi:hypothetical protein